MKTFKKLRDETAEAYATGNHSVSFADTADEKAFKAGADWAKNQIQLDLNEECLNRLLKRNEECDSLKAEVDKLHRLLSGESVEMFCENPGHHVVIKFDLDDEGEKK